MADNISAEAAEAGTPDAPEPVALSPGNRLASLDFIRGIAVLGILAANIVAFGQPWSAYMFPESFRTPHGTAEGWMWVVQFVLIDNKMRGLFTLLFGAGMMLFMEKAWARGRTRWLQARRLAFLLLFGLIHFFFIWRGDILTGYAMVGFIALPFMKLEAKTQLTLGLLGYLAGAVLYAAMMVPLHFIAETGFGQSAAMIETSQALAEGKQEALADDALELEMVQAGRYGDMVAHNFAEHARDPLANVMLFVFETLPFMLIGMALYRMGLFGGRMFEPVRQRRNGWIMLVIGGLLTFAIALWARSTGFAYYATLAAFVGLSPIPQLLMTLGLAMVLADLAPRAGGWLGARLDAAGRMAFSNYIGTSLMMMLVFQGWAIGLFAQLTRGQLYLVVLLAWGIMLLWSKPWLARFRYGPLEWLWRCLTYGRLFPLSR